MIPGRGRIGILRILCLRNIRSPELPDNYEKEEELQHSCFLGSLLNRGAPLVCGKEIRRRAESSTYAEMAAFPENVSRQVKII